MLSRTITKAYYWLRLMLLYYMIGGFPARIQIVLGKEYKISPVKASIGNTLLLFFDPPVPPIIAFLALLTPLYQTHIVVEIGVMFIIVQFIMQTVFRLGYIAIKKKPIGNWERELIYYAFIWLKQADRIERWIEKALSHTLRFYTNTLNVASKLKIRKTNSIKKE
jgi:hypothetical protein